jgi:G:T-mismatch repair DNA endonuclease (very short patch repair protein)
MYLDGQSAQQISSFIKKLDLGINPIKKDILSFLRDNKVRIRNTSEATKEWNASRGGPWNKGLKKKDHLSIVRYSDSRKGTNNPYYKLSEEKRKKIKWWEWKSAEQIAKIRNKIAETNRKNYKDGTTIPYFYLNPEWAVKNQSSRMAGYRKYLAGPEKHKFGNPSLAEKEIATILEEHSIRYVKQFSLSGKYSCDFLLPELGVVLEYYGTYWHCDPRKYERDYYNQKKQRSAQQIWDYDRLREQTIIQNGYNLLVIWEEDYKVLNTQQKKDFIYEAIASKSSYEN